MVAQYFDKIHGCSTILGSLGLENSLRSDISKSGMNSSISTLDSELLFSMLRRMENVTYSSNKRSRPVSPSEESIPTRQKLCASLDEYDLSLKVALIVSQHIYRF